MSSHMPTNTATAVAQGHFYPSSQAAFVRSQRPNRLLPRFLARLAKPSTMPQSFCDPSDLSRCGWGIVFPQKIDPIFRECLRALLDFRAARAASKRQSLFRVLTYHTEETPAAFRARTRLDRDGAPFFLLLVGGIGHIPLSVEAGLSSYHAVGRLRLGIPEEYHRYARGLIASENQSEAPRNDQGIIFSESPSSWKRGEPREEPRKRDIIAHIQQDFCGKIVFHAPTRSAGEEPGADDPFTERLACELLSNPHGGALAVIGRNPQLDGRLSQASPLIEWALATLQRGKPVGAVVRSINKILARENAGRLESRTQAGTASLLPSFLVWGDPATRLPVPDDKAQAC